MCACDDKSQLVNINCERMMLMDYFVLFFSCHGHDKEGVQMPEKIIKGDNQL